MSIHTIADRLDDKVTYIIKCLEDKSTSRGNFADSICDFWPSLSRFQIHARVYKDEMRDSLAPYIAAELREGEG